MGSRPRHDAGIFRGAGMPSGPVTPLPGSKLIALPPEAGRVVSMIVFREKLYVAFEHGVWRRTEQDGWEQIMAVGPL
jgi:hypothetical protein